MDGMEIPQYYVCPISLQIMKDPVTAITGITYDRESIERWLRSKGNDIPTCPVTMQLLPRDSDLTPNHMLRRLIQAWCTANSKSGVDPIITPTAPLSKSHVLKLVKDLQVPHLCLEVLQKMEALATESESNRWCMVEAGVAKDLVSFVIKCFKERMTEGIEEALRILCLTWNSSEKIKNLVNDNHDFLDSLMWVLGSDFDDHVVVKTNSTLLLKKAIEIAEPSLLERLKHDFFSGIMKILRENISKQAVKSALLVLIEACPWGRNKTKIIEAKGVFVLIELELGNSDKNITELIFNLLAELCSCADGREQLLKHAGSVAMISKRILRVSAATDDRAVHVLGLVSRFSATNEVLGEMLRVGAVSKLCMVIQADCASYLKKNAREILRLRSNVWNNSPCISVYLLTGYRT